MQSSQPSSLPSKPSSSTSSDTLDRSPPEDYFNHLFLSRYGDKRQLFWKRARKDVVWLVVKNLGFSRGGDDFVDFNGGPFISMGDTLQVNGFRDHVVTGFKVFHYDDNLPDDFPVFLLTELSASSVVVRLTMKDLVDASQVR